MSRMMNNEIDSGTEPEVKFGKANYNPRREK